MRRHAASESRDAVVFQPIGIIRTRHRLAEHTPVQPVDASGCPLLDIKPFVPRFDMVEGARGGWTEALDDQAARERGRRGFSP